MMAHNQDLRIVSYNCQGFKTRNFSYIDKLFKDSDILLLQEHWFFDFEFLNFKKVLGKCNYFAKSNMKSNILTNGRPYGGVAIVFKSDIDANIEMVETISNRLLACKINWKNDYSNDTILFNVYMPTNSNENNVEFLDIMLEISSIIQIYNTYDVVVGGDFNCNMKSKDDRSKVFQEFSEFCLITLFM